MSFEKLYEKMERVVLNEQFPDTETEPETLPETEPDTETEPKRVPKRSPLIPAPGQEPEPQGLSADMELFKSRRQHLLGEAIHIDPSKKKWIKSGDPELNAMFPKLSDDEKTYLEVIASTQYDDLIKKLEHYTGVKAKSSNIPQLAGILFEAINKAIRIESKHTRELEQLAINMVLGFEEFEMVKQAVDDGDVIFKVALKTPEIKLPTAEKIEDKLGEDEEINLDVANELIELSDLELRKRLSSMLLHGGAVLKSFSFHLVEDRLNSIDKRLSNLYGVASVLAHLGYWLTPFGIEKQAVSSGAVGGAEKVEPHDKIYIIRAEAILFPFLVHEIVKGVYDWISIRPEFSELRRRGVEAETKDLMIGPEIFKAIQSMIPLKKQKFLPLIQKHILGLRASEIREILKKSDIGKKIIDDIVMLSEDEWSEYVKEKF